MINLPNIEGLSFHLEKLPLELAIYREMEGWLGPDQVSYADKRKEDFLAGRYCAKKSLDKFNYNLTELQISKDRSPKWPTGIVGSISHTKSLAIAVTSNTCSALGIDVEENIALERYQKIKHLILSYEEEQLIKDDLVIGATLIFSSKEALYKLIYPMCKQYFGFLEATVRSFGSGEFSISLHSEQDAIKAYNGTFIGKYYLFSGKVLTLLYLK